MPIPSKTDQWIVATLREVEIPTPPAALSSRLNSERRQLRFIPWTAGLGAAVLAAALVLTVTLQPSTTLAQVAQAQAAQTAYTVVNTRILGGGKVFKIVECRDGFKWSIHVGEPQFVSLEPAKDPVWRQASVMDGKRTVTVRHLPPEVDLEEIDGPRPMGISNSFDISKILRSGAAVKSTRIEWHGRRADRFELHTSYRDRGRTETFDQTVIADARSHLPLRAEVMRDHQSWGDTWDYDYRTPPTKYFDLKMGSATIIHDLKAERTALQEKLTGGAIFVNQEQTAEILSPLQEHPVSPVSILTVIGSREKVQANLITRSQLGPITPATYSIDSKPWELSTLEWSQVPAVRDTQLFQREFATVTIGGRLLRKIPVFHVGETTSLLRPFLKR